MSDEEVIVARAVSSAQDHRPHKRAIMWLAITAAVLSVVAVSALALGVRNISAQNKSVTCQASLLQNLSAQSAAGVESGNAIENAAQVLADSEAAQSADLSIVLDMTQTIDARRAALDDFRAQSGAVAQAWSSYVDARKAADKKRAANPVTFRC